VNWQVRAAAFPAPNAVSGCYALTASYTLLETREHAIDRVHIDQVVHRFQPMLKLPSQLPLVANKPRDLLPSGSVALASPGRGASPCWTQPMQ
jgi:hypothetical protein